MKVLMQSHGKWDDKVSDNMKSLTFQKAITSLREKTIILNVHYPINRHGSTCGRNVQRNISLVFPLDTGIITPNVYFISEQVSLWLDFQAEAITRKTCTQQIKNCLHKMFIFMLCFVSCWESVGTLMGPCD